MVWILSHGEEGTEGENKMIIENIVCMIVGILIGYAGMYVAGYKLPRIKELRNDDCERRIRSLHEELRQTKHSLWMARALRAEEHTFIHAPRREK